MVWHQHVAEADETVSFTVFLEQQQKFCARLIIYKPVAANARDCSDKVSRGFQVIALMSAAHGSPDSGRVAAALTRLGEIGGEFLDLQLEIASISPDSGRVAAALTRLGDERHPQRAFTRWGAIHLLLLILIHDFVVGGFGAGF